MSQQLTALTGAHLILAWAEDDVLAYRVSAVGDLPRRLLRLMIVMNARRPEVIAEPCLHIPAHGVRQRKPRGCQRPLNRRRRRHRRRNRRPAALCRLSLRQRLPRRRAMLTPPTRSAQTSAFSMDTRIRQAHRCLGNAFGLLLVS